METYIKQDTNTPEWKESLKKEDIVAIHTNKVLRELNIEFIRIPREDKIDQNRGIDLVLKHPDEPIMIVDEKAAVYWWMKDLQTYAFEVFHDAHKGKKGWLNSEISVASHYLLVYVRSTNETLERIWKWEGLLIRSSLLKQVFEPFEGLIEDVVNNAEFYWSRIKKGEDFAYVLYSSPEDTAKLNFSKRFDKIVINLLLSKTLLKKMSNRILLNIDTFREHELSDKVSEEYIPEDTYQRLQDFRNHFDENLQKMRNTFAAMPVVSSYLEEGQSKDVS